ncbi:MFS transporter [Marinomonas algicola]|uniref:MFS transporter n=1 Tax=Marinomonas algicola TaxID=2773454 RepID=UPI001749A3E2|nr:MFS transporter [Marinomonas algicola]
MFLKSFLADWSTLTAAGRVLVINGFTFNLGFYMMLPYLATHLAQDLGLSGGFVGFIIGLRVLSQQGLFLVGGTLGDYFGYKPMILLGCAVRVVGFALLGIGESLYALILGAFLSGFAGALFTPSSQAYLASDYPRQHEREGIFALQNLASEAGMLLGPVFGLALLSVSFAWIGVTSAVFFALLLVIQWYYLPDSKRANHKPSDEKESTSSAPKDSLTLLAYRSFWHQWLAMLKNSAFIRFACYASVYPLLFHQLYSAIPSEVRLVTDNVSIITWVFVVSSILGVTLQMPMSRLVEKKLGTALGMGLGMGIMGSAYLWLSIETTWLPALPFLICAVFFSIGSMLVFPLLGAYIPTFSSVNELGRYYGLFACIGGVYAFLGNVVTSWLLSSTELEHGVIWLGLFLISCLAGGGLYRQVKHQSKTSALNPL